MNNTKKLIKIIINLQAFHSKILLYIINKILIKLNYINIKINGPASLPTKKQRFTVLRSPHINKKSREQFELGTHKRILILKFFIQNKNDIKKIKNIVKYIKSLCAGAQFKITYMSGKI